MQKEEKKECCCKDGKCLCEFKKFFPHKWFKLKCLSHIFIAFFYAGIAGTAYMIWQLTILIQYARDGRVGYDIVPQMIIMIFLFLTASFLFLAVAKICKALRKIKKALNIECCCKEHEKK